jgi:Fe-S-cluster containining protein
MVFKCQQCLECCKKYWITILPDEAKQQAEFLKISLEKFIEDYCLLYLQLFPAGSAPKQGLTMPASFLPKRIKEKLEQRGLALPDSLMVLPWLAFKRENNQCVFLTPDALCSIHPVRPKQCALFPFISLKENEKDYQKLYPFCKGLTTGSEETAEEQAQHLQAVKAYFADVKEKGFTQVWPVLPAQGKLFFEDEFVCDLSQEEFLQLIKLFQ